jgi:hypothetical protein
VNSEQSTVNSELEFTIPMLTDLILSPRPNPILYRIQQVLLI